MYTHVGMYNIYDNFDKIALYFTRAIMLSTESSFSYAKINNVLLNSNNGESSDDITDIPC